MYGLGMGADYDIPREIIQHYEEDYDEAERLFSGGWGQVELLRTKELIRRFAPSSPGQDRRRRRRAGRVCGMADRHRVRGASHRPDHQARRAGRRPSRGHRSRSGR